MELPVAPAPTQPKKRPFKARRLRIALGMLFWLVAGITLAMAFLAYRQPDFLLDILSLRYCG